MKAKKILNYNRFNGTLSNISYNYEISVKGYHEMNRIKIVYRGGEGEIIEKKSRFIATVCPVNSEEDAARFIEKIKKKEYI